MLYHKNQLTQYVAKHTYTKSGQADGTPVEKCVYSQTETQGDRL